MNAIGQRSFHGSARLKGAEYGDRFDRCQRQRGGHVGRDPSQAQERLLFRLWLSVPNSRPLPEGFDVLWGSIAPGAIRGGAEQPVNRQRSPLVHA